MTFLSALFPGEKLISRRYYGRAAANPTIITAPAKAAFVRVSLSGGGAQRAGAAFSRTKAAATPGETFSLVVGRYGPDSSTPGGDSTFTRVTGSILLCRAKGASVGAGGLASGGVGDTKRSGSTSISNNLGGDAAGDDADPYPLGFGGLGSFENGSPGNFSRYAYPGAGGTYNVAVGADPLGGPVLANISAAEGMACVEFFASDPGY